jgi:hypothetical protein
MYMKNIKISTNSGHFLIKKIFNIGTINCAFDISFFTNDDILLYNVWIIQDMLQINYIIREKKILEMVKIFAKTINLRKIIVIDNDKIINGDYSLSLSLYETISTSNTFYWTNGFTPKNNFLKSNWLTTITHLLSQIRCIKTKELINKYQALLRILSNVSYENKSKLRIKYVDELLIKPLVLCEYLDPIIYVDPLQIMCDEILSILTDTNYYYFFDYLLYLYNKPIERNKCCVLDKHICHNTIYYVKYCGDKIVFSDIINFSILLTYLKNQQYSYIL